MEADTLGTTWDEAEAGGFWDGDEVGWFWNRSWTSPPLQSLLAERPELEDVSELDGFGRLSFGSFLGGGAGTRESRARKRIA